jgi:hypothetical protein
MGTGKCVAGDGEADFSTARRTMRLSVASVEMTVFEMALGNNGCWDGSGGIVARGLFLEKQAQFAGGAVGAKTVGEVEGGSGAGGDGGCADWRVWTKSTEGEEAGGLVEAEAGSELAGGGTEDAAAEGGVEGAEAV